MSLDSTIWYCRPADNFRIPCLLVNLLGSFFSGLTSGKFINSHPSAVYTADLTGSARSDSLFSQDISSTAWDKQITFYSSGFIIFTGFLLASISNKPASFSYFDNL